MKFLDAFQEQIYTVFRIVIGFLFLWHGTQKFFDFPIEYPYGPLSTVTAIAGSIEIIAGILVMVGLFTRPAAFIASGLMAAAYWMAHGLQGVFPISNGGELAAIFCFSFLLIASRGAGMWGFDKD